MKDSWLLTLAPLAGMIVNVALQAALAHLWRRKRTALAIACGALAGLAGAAILAAAAAGLHGAAALFWCALSYLALAFGYWAFLNLNLTSLRIRVLKEILAAPGGTLSQADLERNYDDREMVERRLARLEAANQVVLVSGRYVLKAQGLARTGRLIRFIREVIIPG